MRGVLGCLAWAGVRRLAPVDAGHANKLDDTCSHPCLERLIGEAKPAPDHKMESPMTLPHSPAFVGVDVGKHDLVLAHHGQPGVATYPNTASGIAALARSLACDGPAHVALEATGGYEWPLWEALDAVGMSVRQVAPAEVRAFARSRGSRAKTDAIDAQIRACPDLARAARLLSSIPGVGPVLTATLLAEMPELGRISGKAAAALTGLAPIARDSGKLRGQRSIAGGRRHVRQVAYMAATVARTHNPDLAAFFTRLQDHGMPHKKAACATARKLIVLANSVLKRGTPWQPNAPT